MVTVFRATVMLAVLVGLPAAWIYYGPLPPAAMGVIQRTVTTAKQSFGLSGSPSADAWLAETPKSAPRFDNAPLLAVSTEATSVPTAFQAATNSTTAGPSDSLVTTTGSTPLMQDSQFSLASATVPMQTSTVQASAAQQNADGSLAKLLDPHLSLLRSMNAADYTLENWGADGQLYRFRCAVALGDTVDHTRQFEAIHSDPLQAVHQVVGEVTSWQNARRLDGPTRWR